MQKRTNNLIISGLLVAMTSACAEKVAHDVAPTPGATTPGVSTVAPTGSVDVIAPAGPGELVSVLRFIAPANVEGPRMAEVYVRHSGDLEFVSAQSLSGVSNGEKTLVAQQKPGGLVRLVVYSASNLTRMQTGDLAALRFHRLAGGAGRVEVVQESSAFAPSLIQPSEQSLQLRLVGEAP